ncbi:MAG: hypothetical protein HOF21_06070 [Nitrospina sp.]|jgi:hypothetical protein|nr:hypothetical protein [Nitrospina sp.]MBT5633691.1 hypothetical protein [Nitrospina sp.]
MKHAWRYFSLLLLLIFSFSGCASMNEPLDSANESAEEIGKPVGKIMKIPGSATKGAAEGMHTKENDPNNPYDR